MSTKTPFRKKKQSETKSISDEEARPQTQPTPSLNSSLKSKSKSSKKKRSNPDNNTRSKLGQRSKVGRLNSKTKNKTIAGKNVRKTSSKLVGNQSRRLKTRSSAGSIQFNRAESGRSVKRREMSKSSRSTKSKSSIMLERLDEERLLRAALSLDKAPKSRGRLERMAAREKEKEAIVKNAKVTRTQPSQPKLLSSETEKSKSRKKKAGISQPFFRMKMGSKNRSSSKLRAKSPSSSSQRMYVMNESEMFKVFRGFLKQITPKKHWATQSKKPSQSQGKDTVIENAEMLEILYDELIELFSNVNTLKNSYHDIVNSLVSMQKKPRRRSSKQQQLLPIFSDNFESSDQLKNQKRDEFRFTRDPSRNLKVLEKYMDPQTRDDAFKQLFQRVERFKSNTQNFCACFDQDGRFCENKYKNYIKKYGGVTFHLYTEWHSELRDLDKIVGIILQEYNREVLELFRLSITQSK